MTGAREEVLARIRAGAGPSLRPQPVVRDYAGAGSDRRTSVELADVLRDRLLDYRAEVAHASPDGVQAVVAKLLGDERVVVVVADGVPAHWRPQGRHDVRDDAALTAQQLDSVQAVLTGAALAIAETGTIVLDAGPACGRRVITLVPDHHVVVLGSEQVVATVPDAVRRLEATRPLTWISGPSATSDIELDRVEGVHGPRRLSVVLVTERTG